MLPATVFKALSKAAAPLNSPPVSNPQFNCPPFHLIILYVCTEDNHHKRCKFPEWITEHHTWLSLDKKKIYKFSQKNATLKILDEDITKHNKIHQQQGYTQTFGFQEFGFESQDQRRQNSEARVMCHSILQSVEQRKVQIVAHVTAGW